MKIQRLNRDDANALKREIFGFGDAKTDVREYIYEKYDLEFDRTIFNVDMAEAVEKDLPSEQEE